MPTSTEVAGISIGIGANIGDLDTQLDSASSKINAWKKKVRDLGLNIKVEVSQGASWKTIEKELTEVLARVAKGQTVPLEFQYVASDTSITTLKRTIQAQLNERKIHIPIEWEAKVDVAVEWHWADGKGPGDGGGRPGDGGVEVSTPRRSGTPRKTTASAKGDTKTPDTTQAPAKDAAPAKAKPVAPTAAAALEPAKPRRQTGRVQATVVTPPPEKTDAAAAPEAKKGGIEGMATGTPLPKAARENEARIAANTAAAGLGEIWKKATRKFVETNLGRPITIPPEARQIQMQYRGGQQTDAVRYQLGGKSVQSLPPTVRQPERSFAQTPEPRAKTAEDTLIEEILAMVSPAEGQRLKASGEVPSSLPKGVRKELQARISAAMGAGYENQVRREDRREDKTRVNSAGAYQTGGGADWRTERWFDAGTSVDPARREAMQASFLSEQAAQEGAEWKRLQEVFGANDEDREKILHNWAGKSEQGKKMVSAFGAGGIKKLAKALGEVMEYSDKEITGTLAEAQTLVEKGQYNAAQDVLRPIIHQTRQVILKAARTPAVGAKRLAALRGGAGKTGKTKLPTVADYPKITDPAEQARLEQAQVAFMAASAIRQTAYQRQEFLNKDLRVKDAAEQAGETRKDRKEGVTGGRAVKTKFVPTPLATPTPGGGRSPTDAGEAAFMGRTPLPAVPAEPGAEYVGLSREQMLGGMGRTASSRHEVKPIDIVERPGTPQVEGGLTREVRESIWQRSQREQMEAKERDRVARARDVAAKPASAWSPTMRPLPRDESLEEEIKGEGHVRLSGGFGAKSTKQKGLTGAHRIVSEEVRANTGFCVHCGTPFDKEQTGHGEHSISREEHGGPEHIAAACPVCNNLKGSQSLLQWLPRTDRPSFKPVDAYAAHQVQQALHPERMWNHDVLGIHKPIAVDYLVPPEHRRGGYGARAPKAKIAPAQAMASELEMDESTFRAATPEMQQQWIAAYTAAGVPLPAYAQPKANKMVKSPMYGRKTLFGTAKATFAGTPTTMSRWSALSGVAGLPVPPLGPPPTLSTPPTPPPPPGQQGAFFAGPPLPPPPVAGGGAGAPPAAGGAGGGTPFNYRFGQSAKSRANESLKVAYADSQAEFTKTYEKAIEQKQQTEDYFVTRNAQLDDTRNRIQQDIAATPVRALSVSIGQFVATKLGRGAVLERKRHAEALLRISSSSLRAEHGYHEELVSLRAREKLAKANPETTPEELAAYHADASRLKRQERAARQHGEATAEAAAKAEKGISPLATQLTNLATVGVSIVGGTLLFKAMIGVATEAMKQLGPVVDRAADQLSGWSATLKKVQDEMVASALPTGDVHGAVATRLAASGIGGMPGVTSVLEARTTGLTAAARLQTAQETLHTVGAARLQNQEFGGQDASLYSTQGGLAGTFIGGTPPITELIGNELDRLRGNVDATTPRQGLDALPPPFFPMAVLFGGKADPKRQQEALQQQQDYFQYLNTAMGKGGGTDRFGAPGPQQDLNNQTGDIAKQIDALRGIGGSATEMADAIANGSAAMRDSSGHIITDVQQIRDDWEKLAKGLAMPSGQAVYDLMKKSINAQLMALQDQYTNAVQIQGPISAYTQYSRNRPLPFGTGLQPGAAGAAAYQQFQQFAVPAQAQYAAYAARGRDTAINLAFPGGGDSAAKTQFISNLNTIEAGSKLISNIEVGLANTQASLTHEMQTVSRGAQALQLQLSQREINFGLAVAGFTAAGATPAEAAAQLDQAKLEAGFKQKQLDASKQIFQIEGKQISFSQTALAGQQTIDAIRTSLAGVFTEVDAATARGMGVLELGQATVRDVYLNSGEILKGISNDINDAFMRLNVSYSTWIADIGNAGMPGAPSLADNRTPSGHPLPPAASGALFNTAGAYSMTVGEAGTETVAVLRNPRPMMSSGGGGGGNVQININGPVVRDDSDINKIAVAVEQVLDRRASLLGMRR